LDYPINDSCRYIPQEETYVLDGYDLIYIDKANPVVRELKEFERGYFVMYNPMSEKYEVHNKDNIGNTYCLTTYRNLDSRTIELVQKTHVTRADILAKDAEKSQELYEKRRARERRNTIEAITADEVFPKYAKERIYSTA